MTTSQPRQPKGQPVGGQFAGKHQTGDEVGTLGTLAPSNPWDLAASEGTSSTILDRLANDPEQSLRLAVAENPNTDVSTLERLSRDRDHHVRSRTARHPNMTNHMSNTLMKDEYWGTRLSLANNPHTPPDHLDQLSRDPHQWVQVGAIENQSTPLDTLMTIAESGSLDHRFSLAQTPHMAGEVLLKLAHDPDTWVSELAIEHPNAPEDTLEHLANSRDEQMRGRAAFYSTSADMTTKLSADRSPIVRGQVASSTRAPGHIIHTLATDPDREVRGLAIKNINGM